MALQSVENSTKQLIALVSAIIGISLTLTANLVGDVQNFWLYATIVSWILFLCSIIAGLFALGAISYQIAPQSNHELNIFSWSIRGSQLAQYTFFFVGLWCISTVLLFAPKDRLDIEIAPTSSISERVEQTIQAYSVAATVTERLSVLADTPTSTPPPSMTTTNIVQNTHTPYATTVTPIP